MPEAESPAQKNVILENVKFERPSILRLSAISQYCWFANVEVKETDFDMLIDTGSAVTIISKDAFDAQSNQRALACFNLIATSFKAWRSQAKTSLNRHQPTNTYLLNVS